MQVRAGNLCVAPLSCGFTSPNVGSPVNRALDLAQTNAASTDPRTFGASLSKAASSVRHLVELLRADMAGPGASLAMIHGVFGAFFTACLADFRAQLANLRHELASAAHEASGESADRGAVHVERNASSHHVCVGLLQAGDRAVVAGIGAGVAGVDAGLIHLVLHGEVLSANSPALRPFCGDRLSMGSPLRRGRRTRCRWRARACPEDAR